jgi:3'-phosphoadenosine 5'-phosphosulfate sulfotransferase (PAPS reductase)/FAD synthetase
MQLLWLNLWVYLSSAFSNYNLSPLRGQYSLLRMQELESKAHAEHDAYELYLALRNTSATDPKLGTAIHSALDVLDNTLRLYGPDNVYSSYNGGKDAVVIMHLLRASVAKYSKETGVTHSPLLVYFAVNDEFPEVINYIEETEELYGLRVQRSNSSIIKGLNEIIQAKKETGGDHQQHLAFVLGTRKGDPNCGDQSFFSPSSSWMPPFMRVNPIIGWTYGQVHADNYEYMHIQTHTSGRSQPYFLGLGLLAYFQLILLQTL